jgi:hypothetical protein
MAKYRNNKGHKKMCITISTKIRSKGHTTTIIHPLHLSDGPIYRKTQIGHKQNTLIKIDTDATNDPVAIRFFDVDGTILEGRKFCILKEKFWSRDLVGCMIGRAGDTVTFTTKNVYLRYVCTKHGWKLKAG